MKVRMLFEELNQILSQRLFENKIDLEKLLAQTKSEWSVN